MSNATFPLICFISGFNDTPSEAAVELCQLSYNVHTSSLLWRRLGFRFLCLQHIKAPFLSTPVRSAPARSRFVSLSSALPVIFWSLVSSSFSCQVSHLCLDGLSSCPVSCFLSLPHVESNITSEGFAEHVSVCFIHLSTTLRRDVFLNLFFLSLVFLRNKRGYLIYLLQVYSSVLPEGTWLVFFQPQFFFLLFK